MEKLNIVFVDMDQTYLEPLVERFINELGNDKLDVTILTRAESFQEYFSVLRHVDILIINRNMYSELLIKHDTGNTFYLSETESQQTMYDIYKYTSTKDIFDFIIAHLKNITNEKLYKAKECSILSVYSPLGGCGKTTLAIAMSRVLSQKGKKVLYISGEDIQNYETLVNAAMHLGIDFASDVLGGIGLDELTFRKYCGDCGFHYLLPVEGSLYSSGYSFADFVRVAIMAKKSKLYDHIIFDMPSDFSKEVCGFLMESDMNFVVVRQDEMSASKIDKFMSVIDYKSTNKFTFFCNMFDGLKENYLTENRMKNKCVSRVTINICKTGDICTEIASDKKFVDYIESNI